MRIVIALGGNALLRRGQVLSAAAQQDNISLAAQVLASIAADGHQLIITHGNGPQVGLLALQSAAGPSESTLPLDVLDAESEGWVGYAIELALRNALPHGTEIVTLLTQTLVDPADPAFHSPVKPVGPLYDEATAKRLAAESHWSVAPDGNAWRRVVASPRPLGIVEIASIRRLADAGVIVICGGGGGIPVCEGPEAKLSGVEAVIDKDATSALLATQIEADMFIMLTDVNGVYLDFGTDHARMITRATPQMLDAQTTAFKAGSMGPKVQAACDFVNASGRTAGIGALADAVSIIGQKSGTIIATLQPDMLNTIEISPP
jgi:carbamate kinase